MNWLYALILFTLCTLSFGQASEDNTVGLLLNKQNTFTGYTLFSPSSQKQTFLIDSDGKLVHSWDSKSVGGHTVYLNEDGTLYRTGRVETDPVKTHIKAGGAGGRIERYGWDSELLWEYEYADIDKRHHHDFKVLPNGNILILAWEAKSKEEAIQAGRNPELIDTETNELWPDHLVEVKPQGASGGEIIWEWHIWDHLIQDFDPSKDNFGVIEEHPELVNINFIKPSSPTNPDWNHINAIDYNSSLDQIMLSVHAFNELWIIDHSTTLEEAKSHGGGNAGKGGDLLYRWGNPEAYNMGDLQNRKLFRQHNVHWIHEGLPNAGKIMIFNNGKERPNGEYSSIEILDPKVGEDYVIGINGVFEPEDTFYKYTASKTTDFYAPMFSSAQQLPNGNILICDGPKGTFFEIDNSNQVLWKYVNPVTPDGILTQGDSPIGVNSVFHVIKLEASYPGFNNKELLSGDYIEKYPVIVTNINKENNIDDLIFYPNPADDMITVLCNCDLIEIFDINGLLDSLLPLNEFNQVNISNLPEGIYIVSCNERNKKLLIQR